ncbi:MAG: hypothetical protein ACFB3T_15910 [Geminicoccaceae bacterium]
MDFPLLDMLLVYATYAALASALVLLVVAVVLDVRRAGKDHAPVQAEAQAKSPAATGGSVHRSAHERAQPAVSR